MVIWRDHEELRWDQHMSLRDNQGRRSPENETKHQLTASSVRKLIFDDARENGPHFGARQSPPVGGSPAPRLR